MLHFLNKYNTFNVVRRTGVLLVFFMFYFIK